MTTVSLNWSLVVTVGWRGQHLFLYNHGTKNDLHTFEVFQRTRIEEEDWGGCKSVLTEPFTEQFADLRPDKRREGWPGSSQRKWRC